MILRTQAALHYDNMLYDPDLEGDWEFINTSVMLNKIEAWHSVDMGEGFGDCTQIFLATDTIVVNVPFRKMNELMDNFARMIYGIQEVKRTEDKLNGLRDEILGD